MEKGNKEKKVTRRKDVRLRFFQFSIFVSFAYFFALLALNLAQLEKLLA